MAEVRIGRNGRGWRWEECQRIEMGGMTEGRHERNGIDQRWQEWKRSEMA
jgi:hypothetical protein